MPSVIALSPLLASAVKFVYKLY